MLSHPMRFHKESHFLYAICLGLVRFAAGFDEMIINLSNSRINLNSRVQETPCRSRYVSANNHQRQEKKGSDILEGVYVIGGTYVDGELLEPGQYLHDLIIPAIPGSSSRNKLSMTGEGVFCGNIEMKDSAIIFRGFKRQLGTLPEGAKKCVPRSLVNGIYIRKKTGIWVSIKSLVCRLWAFLKRITVGLFTRRKNTN